ncbi:hypothetical protein AVEN_229243-1, partial [Araneus ventricosus]
PGVISKRSEERKAARRARDSLRKKKIAPENDFFSPVDALSYGSNAQKPDLDSETFKIKKEKFINNLAVSKEEAHRILMETAIQSLSHLWIAERRKRLTASNSVFVCNRLPHTKCDNIVKRILYSNFESSCMKYGKKHEKDAIEELKKMGIKIKSSGLFIDENLPFLAATPDGLIDDDGTVEIKCPSSCSVLTPKESILKRKITFWTIDKKKIMKLKVLTLNTYIISKFRVNYIFPKGNTAYLLSGRHME